MKAIWVENKVANKIVSLENVKEIELYTSGSGAKSNPFCHTIRIDYFNGENSHLCFEDDLNEAKRTLENIFKILIDKSINP